MLTRALLSAALAAVLCGLPAREARAGDGGRVPRVAADTLRGRVTDEQGAPLAGAEVVLEELDRRATAERDGSFAFPNVAPGRYTLVVRRVGYAPLVRRVDVRRTATLTLALRAAAQRLEPVTVTATRAPIEPLASPLPIAALGRESLRREHGVSLSHALGRLAGVQSLNTGEQVGKPVIRGLAGARVLVLDNGLRLEDYSWSDEDGPSVDVRLAERVEVIRGPASVLYGSDAIGGVVNVIPEPLPQSRGDGGFVRGGVELYGASNNRELGTALRLEGAAGALGWRAFGVGRHADDYHTPTGELRNTGFGAVNGDAALGIRGGRGTAMLRYTRYGGEFKLLEANAPPEEGGGPERKLSDDRLQFAGSMPVGGARLETKAQWERHSLRELADEPGAAPGEGESVQFDLLLNSYTVDVLAHHALGARVSGVVGASGLYQTNDTRGPEPLVPGARVSSGALFAFEQATLGRWSFLAGARGDARHLSADANEELALAGESRNYTAFSGDVGVVFRPRGDVAIAANAGRAWRAPTLFELFANGPQIGEARFVRGSSGLRTESGLNVDVSVRWEGERARLSLAAYRNAIDRYIYLAPTDATVDGLRVYDYAQADALLWGGEATAEVDPASVLTLRGRVDAVRGTNRELGEPLPLVPPPRAAFEAELHSSSLSWADRAYLTAETELAARQTRPSPFDVVTPGYTLLHAGAGIARRLGGRPVRLDARVRNVANTRYANYLSRYKEFALDPGRTVVLRLSTGL